MPLPVIYEDAHLLVLDKPAGLLSVPGRGDDKQDCLSARVQAHFPDALIVHRLDMATSGLMLMARGPAMQRALSQAFASRQVNKRYLAVVDGAVAAPTGPWGLIDLPIALDWPNRPLRVIDALTGKSSQTRWQLADALAEKPLANSAQADVVGFDRNAPFTRLLLEPVTGRSHQLRVHLAATGHPILGDALYAPAPVQVRANRLLLHACLLALAHPLTGDSMTFESPAGF